jgi:hypothetical protein
MLRSMCIPSSPLLPAGSAVGPFLNWRTSLSVISCTYTTGFFDGDDRTSQVPGGPHYERALLSDPGGTSALGDSRALVLSSAKWTASTPATNTNFAAQSHGPLTRCIRFAGWITPPPRKTRFRMVGHPFRAGLVTRWVPTKGFRSSHPPFPGFTWRTQIQVSKWARPDCQKHAYFEFYNHHRLHQALAYRTPRQVFDEAAPLASSARGKHAGAHPTLSAQ